MALRIRYVPVNSSHMGKTLPVLTALREASAEVRILCLDEVQVELYHVIDQIRRLDFENDSLPRGSYRPHPHWFRCAVQRGSLARAVDSFLDSDSSDLFVLADDTALPTRILARTLVRRGTPCVLIVDGLQPPLRPHFRPPARARMSHAVRRILNDLGPRGTSGVHRVLVMTRTCRSVLESYGIPAARIVVVGSPEYDRLAAGRHRSNEGESARMLRSRLGIDSERPVVFYAHQDIFRREIMEDIVGNLADGCRRAGATLLVKFHPRSRDDLDGWRRWAEMRGIGSEVAVFYRNECTSIEAVQACAACVTAFSTVSLEAMIFERPLIVLQYLPARETLSFASDYGAALDVNSREDLAETLHAAVNDPRIREKVIANAGEALRQELYGPDGRSVERTVKVILELGARH